MFTNFFTTAKEESRWFLLDERIRFIIVGMGNTLIRYLIFVVMGIALSISHYQFILASSWVLSSVTAFFAYKIFVFKTKGNHWKEYGKSLLIWSLSYLINAGILELLVKGVALNPYLSQAIAILLITVVNYLLFKHFAFRQQKKQTFWERLYNIVDQ